MLLAIFVALAIVVLALLQSCAPAMEPPTGPLGVSDSAYQKSHSHRGGTSNNEEDCYTSRGAPIWHFDFNNLNLVVQDTPIWIDSAYGPSIEFTLTYNALGKEDKQSSVGSRWKHNYADYVSKPKDSSSLVLVSGTGRVDEYQQVGTNYILNSQSLLSGEATLLPRLSVEEDVIKATYVDGSYKTFTQVNNGDYRLSSVVDQSGNGLKFAYQDNQLMSVTNALEQTLTLSYNQAKQVVSVTGPTGYKAHFDYNQKGELISLEDMQGYSAQITYDDMGIISSLTDAKGTTKFIVELGEPDSSRIDEYPAFGDPMGMSSRMTVVNPLGFKEEFFYNSQTGKAWYVSPQHYVDYVDVNVNNSQPDVPKTVYDYQRYSEGYSRVQQITKPDGTWTRFEYDNNRNLSQTIYSDGNSVKYRNNSFGKVVEFTDTLNNSTIYVYDDRQNLIKAVTPTGEKGFEYSQNNLLISATNLNGAKTRYKYNDQGQLLQVTDADGNVVDFGYSSGRLESIVSQGKALASYQYDELGRVTQVTDIHGKATQYRYDRINQLTHVSEEGSRDTEIVYGSCPRLLESETLPGGRAYQYQYNSAKQLVAIVDPMQGVTRIERDASGRIEALIDANQNKTEFEYNSVGQLTTKRYADGSEITHDYQQGYVRSTTNARGITKSFHYNGKKQLTRVSYSDATPEVSYQYDTLGRLSSVSDAQGTTGYHYYPDGRLKRIDGPWQDDTIELEFDKLNRVSALTLNGLNFGKYQYDTFGRLTSVSALEQVFELTYDDTPQNVASRLTYPNGIEQVLSFDDIGDISKLEYRKGEKTVGNFVFGFDVAGKLTQLESSELLPLERPQVQATYNSLNQISSWDGDSKAFVYDSDGNLIQGLLPGETPFFADYDAENRLTEIRFEKNGAQVEERFEYGHDHFLRVYQRFENNIKTAEKRFVRLGLIELQERDSENNVLANNVWRPDRKGGVAGLLMRQQSQQNTYYMTNHLGHVYGVFDRAGERLSQRGYSPYGQVSGDDFALQPFGMSTKRSDFTSGIVYFGYRFYMPNLGRWLNRDPLQEQGGINLYAYVDGDPLGYVDPDGRFAVAMFHPAVAIPVSYAVCRALGGCEIPEFPDWPSWQNSEEDSGTETESCPSNDPDDWEKVPRSNQAYKPKGAKEPIFERDQARGNSHGGSFWKKWNKKRDWKNGKYRDGTYNEDGKKLRG
ncbi:RHS repeat protein [Vibrio brasiliensis]|uniref:RHS repeat domain-containing protein n=1 Tax=Vibrio brasiliensis TaxID=170652 RepID=UPI001EFD25C0|nr:RHS repeat-associated core domain-containing protein [Vibrio brasiliensis]MCG9752332.1 RHS repeat protein [Vibrio brasiliensis]